jgi:hypothetical protein
VTFSLPRAFALVALLGGLLGSGTVSRADELQPGALAPRAAHGRSSLAVALSWARRPEKQSEWAGSLVLTVPTSGWLASPRKAKHAAEPPEELEPCDEEHHGADSETDGPPDDLGRAAPPLPRLRTADVAAAIRAARQAAGLSARRLRLDDLASRARWSSALPNVRLRVTRLIDESASLSPTSYDADRHTASGGTSLWLEARTTWQLDRALFASEEVRLERLWAQALRERARVSQEVLGLLLSWQQAVAELTDQGGLVDFATCRRLWLRQHQLALEVDVATGGWFSRWASRDPIRRPSMECAARPPVVAARD